MVQQKITAFRDFASQLASQVVEQLCQEFEREVSVLHEDVILYRNELTRCAELLGHQLGREKQLHQLLANMADHHANVATSVNVMAQQSPNHQQLHEMVDAMCGQHVDILNSTLQGVNHAHSVAQTHAQTAKQHQESMITTENEFNRIVQLLQTPVIEERRPDPTWATIPTSPAVVRATSSPAKGARPAVRTGPMTSQTPRPFATSPPLASYMAPSGPAAAMRSPTTPAALSLGSPPASIAYTSIGT